MTYEDSDISRHRPTLSQEATLEIVRKRYGLTGDLRPLPSDKDQNFLFESSDGRKFVAKYAHALEQRELLDAQHAILFQLDSKGLGVQRAVEGVDGSTIYTVEDSEGRSHYFRMLTYLEGVLLADVRPTSSALMASLGSYLGRVDAVLAEFDHPGTHRDYVWDLARAGQTVSDYREYLDSDRERTFVDRFASLYDDVVAPELGTLRKSVIYNDANDRNILVNGPENSTREVIGLIDFGDVVRTITAAEPAIAAAYSLMGAPEPLRTAAALVGGYHAAHPLGENEVRVLFPLIGMRLCVSICLSAYQRRLEPANEYLVVSREPALRLLAQLSEIHPRYAEYVLRMACGMEPCTRSPIVTQWLESHVEYAAAIVDPDPAKTVVFDFSVGSSEWSFAELTQPPAAADTIKRRMSECGAAVGVGRYDEVRIVYRGDQFEAPTERRTVHLGVDLFQPPGSVVRAPLEGVIHSVADNDRPYDYGPTAILEHRPTDGPVFYTLYGHLSHASVASLQPGMPVSKGAAFAEIGTTKENGGWAPHLHFQVIADLLGHQGDFPGVAAPWQREVWLSICPDPGVLARIGAEGRAPREDGLLEARLRHVGPSLRISYRHPLRVRRGHGQYLFDHDGGRHLDTVNNVAHVGHCHPRIVEAVARGMRVLNTNTRYLYGELTRYAERLAATLPDPLEICYIVNSGSEANDLALRMARAYTGARDVVVVDYAYHGSLSSLIEISPYKFNGPGGSGRPEHTHVVPMPDPLRRRRESRQRISGPDSSKAGFSGGENAWSENAAPAWPAEIIRGIPSDIAAFIAESAMSCGGQVFYPDGFLRDAFDAVREVGALCIADEVQTGFGRVGSSFWAFELQGVIPDIVTLGKPIGNGHPLGAVVTTREIARAFDTGMEYFNTFGGNPVACAAGLAVLDVLRDENLQEHARTVGDYFIELLTDLRMRHRIIGDVRGAGLFIGVELVRSRVDNTPAPEETSYVVERMREEGILGSLDGPYRNVIKIKPPLVIEPSDAEFYVDTLEEILFDDFVRARLE